MFGIPTICKHFFHMRKITKNDSGEFQMINENGLVIAEREVWSKNFLFFGPIPEMPVVE